MSGESEKLQVGIQQDFAHLSLFKDVELDPFRDLLGSCAVRELAVGEVLLEKNQRNEHIYVVVQGRLSIHLHESKEAIAVVREGELAGEMSIIVDELTSARVEAQSHCKVLEITGDILWRMVSADINFARNLVQMFAKRLMWINNQMDRAKQLQEKYKEHAYTDALTGLYNRRWLNDNLAHEMSRCELRNTRLSLLVIDIDHFKKYNDRHGHLAGDEALKAVTGSLRIGLRDLDMAVRYGGEEMMVILPGADIRTGEKVAARLHEAISQAEILYEGKTLPGVTVSIGIACMEPSDTDEGLMRRADLALYEAKREGRNQTRTMEMEIPVFPANIGQE